MLHRQPRPAPTRIYEPNIIHNPREWMGIWTPHGWRVHRMRFAKAVRKTVTLSGDGQTTFFPEALLDPDTGQVEWQDDLHQRDDSFTDTGLYPCDPRVEYPPGRPRWAISHTLMCMPVADHTLYTHEYTWDMVHGHLQTHFRKHIALEEARTDGADGTTVRVQNTPISRGIEGNVHYPMCNSAVRGVWASRDKSSENLYARRIVQLIAMHNAVYAIAPHGPVVQCDGMWAVQSDDPLDELFDRDTGIAIDPFRLINKLHVPLDEPKIAFLQPPYVDVASKVYDGNVKMMSAVEGVVGEQHLSELQQRMGSRNVESQLGYAATHGPNGDSPKGYSTVFDFNGNGAIDEQDERRLRRHLGRPVRYNAYLHAYFGGDWLTTSVCMASECKPGTPVIADYTFGGGYDAEAGVIHLQNSPGPNQPVWVEYHHDTPAEAGEHNIRVHLYQEVTS